MCRRLTGAGCECDWGTGKDWCVGYLTIHYTQPILKMNTVMSGLDRNC